jgi:hypothetical protein
VLIDKFVAAPGRGIVKMCSLLRSKNIGYKILCFAYFTSFKVQLRAKSDPCKFLGVITHSTLEASQLWLQGYPRPAGLQGYGKKRKT